MTRTKKSKPGDKRRASKPEGTIKKPDYGEKKPKPLRKLSPLQERMKKQLDGGKFRMLNESLYTSTGSVSKTMMEENPELFHVYHTGYVEQVTRWPRNPLDDVISYLRKQDAGLSVADLGCGEARLAKEVPQKSVASFDLVAVNDNVIACDIAKVPLADSSVDIAVFCLSLMGTNYVEFLKEARRILVPGGLVLVAEVASRFQNHEPGQFAQGVCSLGFRQEENHPFVLRSVGGNMGKKKRKKAKQKEREDDSKANELHKPGAFFVKFAFKSTRGYDIDVSGRNQNLLPELLPCLYKKR